VAVSADGLKLYVACDSSGSTSGPTGSVTSTPPNPGSILEFTFSQGVLTQSLKQPESMPAENTRNKTVDVYPNPANQFVVVYNYTNERRTVSLIDLNGRLVLQQAAQQTTRINTGSLAPGFYILKVHDARNKNIRTEKIIIRH
jgi:hypothetical protein